MRNGSDPGRAVVKGLHALIDRLAPMLPGTGECFAIQALRHEAWGGVLLTAM